MLVVTATPARRRLWEERAADDQTVVRHCAGPTAECPLITGGSCALLDACDTVLYDNDVVTPDLLVALLSTPPQADVHFVASEPGGPRTTHVLTAGIVLPAEAGRVA